MSPIHVAPGYAARTLVGGVLTRIDVDAPVVTLDPALASFRTAMDNSATTPVNIAVVGSSTSEGLGSSSYRNEYVGRLRDYLRARRGIIGGTGFIPATQSTGYTGTDLPVTNAAGAVNYSLGWGLKCTFLSTANTGVLTFKFYGTSAKLVVRRNTGSTTLRVAVDGGTQTAMQTGGGSVAEPFYRLTLPAMTEGVHTVVVTYPASGSGTYVVGLETFTSDETKGVRIYNGAHGGKKASDFANATTGWDGALTTIGAHLVILQLGNNDFLTGVPSADFKTSLTTLVTKIKAAVPSANIAIYLSPRIAAGSSTEPWANYDAVTRAVASEQSVALFDVSAFQESPVTNFSTGLYNNDSVHPTDKGHDDIAQHLAEFLDPAVPTRPTAANMPTADLTGWNLVYSNDFNTPVLYGEAFDKLGFYLSGYGTTTSGYTAGYFDTSGNGSYLPQHTVNVHHGMLDTFMRTKGGVISVGAPRPWLTADVGTSDDGVLYGRWSVRMRAERSAGYKVAFLGWPVGGNWDNGELDWPEATLDGTAKGFVHKVGGGGNGNVASVDGGVLVSDWHIYTIEWTPTYVAYLLDGVEKLRTTLTTGIPVNPMRWILQAETVLNAATPPDSSEAAHVLVDWVAVWAKV